MFESIDFGQGKIVYDDLKYLDEFLPLEEQIDSLKEDLFQVNYSNQYIIDVGWFPSFSLEGQFTIVLIKDYDWTNPVYKVSIKTISELKKSMEQCVSVLSNLIK